MANDKPKIILPSEGVGESRLSLSQANDISDPDEIAERFTHWNARYEQLSHGKFVGAITECWVNDIQIFEEVLSQQIFMTGSSRPDSVSIGVLSSLSGNAIWHGEAFNMDHVACMSQQENLELNTPNNSRMLSVSIPFYLFPDTIDEEAHESNFKKLVMGEHANFVCDPRLAQEVRDKLQGLIDSLRQHPERFSSSQVQRILTSEVIGLAEDYAVSAHAKPIAPSLEKASRVVRMAREFVESKPDTPVSVLELCQVTFTSRRTLQYCFEKIVGVSPAAYLKMIRLNAVKRELSHASALTSVSDVAAQWGFWHLSQFASDYRKSFGVLPSDTLKKAHGLMK